MQTKTIAIVAGFAVGYFLATKLAAYPGFQQAYMQGAAMA